MDNIDDCAKNKSDILKRLKRIEGQVRGIQKMVEEEKNCSDILTQVAAIRSAINKVGSIVLEGYSTKCILENDLPEEKEKKIAELMNVVQKFLNFVD